MAKIVRYCVLEESHSGDNDFRVYRGTTFGNPFVHTKSSKKEGTVKVKTKEEAIARYEKYFDRMVDTNDQFKKEVEKMCQSFFDNDIIYIGCYCSPSSICHGDVIAKKIKKMAIKKILEANR